MAAAAILDFGNFKFLTVGTLKRVELRLRAKCCRNRSNRGWDMAIFQFFKMAAAAILDFWHLKFLTVGTPKRVELHHRIKFRRNRAKGSWDMAIFRFDFFRFFFGFAKFQIFDDRDGQEVRNASSCQIASKSIKPRPRYSDFSRWRPLPSLIFKIWNLTFGAVKSVELHHRAKFRRNRSNRGRDMWVSILC